MTDYVRNKVSGIIAEVLAHNDQFYWVQPPNGFPETWSVGVGEPYTPPPVSVGDVVPVGGVDAVVVGFDKQGKVVAARLDGDDLVKADHLDPGTVTPKPRHIAEDEVPEDGPTPVTVDDPQPGPPEDTTPGPPQHPGRRSA